MKVAVLYQSLRGGTRRAAAAVGAAFEDEGATVGVYPVTNFDWNFAAKADLLVIGTWTDGIFGIGARPAQIGKLNTLPAIAHKNVALFVTYEISPKASLEKFEGWAQRKGANVVARAGVRRGKTDGIDDFAREALAAITPANA